MTMTITGVIDRITSALAAVASVAIGLMMLHIVISVIARSGFGYSIPGTITIVSSYYMVVVVCLPLAYVERKDAHISVDFLTNYFPKRLQVRLFGWTFLLSALVFGLVAYSSWQEAIAKFAIGQVSVESNMAIPTWVGYFAVPVGYAMGTVYVLLRFVRFIAGKPLELSASDLESKAEKFIHD
jgi:TRAP-type C4-dicarboxylate transport system permease small subunit